MNPTNQSGKDPKRQYDRLFRLVIIAMIAALAVLLVLVVALFASGALSGGKHGDEVVILTGDTGDTTDGTTDEPDETEDNSGLVFPGGNNTDNTETNPLETERETTPVTEPQVNPIDPDHAGAIVTDDNAAVPRYMGLDKIGEEFPGTVLAATGDMGQEYIDDTVFLGDSRTYGLRVFGMLKDGKDTKQVWVPSNGTLLLNKVADAKIYYPDTGGEITVRQAVREKKPKRLIIALGINGVSYLKEDGFIAQFTELIGEIKKESPDTVIILQSILPVSDTYKLQQSINNNKICRGNYWMAKAASQNGVYYLNTAEALVGSDGFLPADMQSGDGLHLNTEAYNIPLDYIRTHGAG